MLALPAFLLETPGGAARREDVLDAFRLTGYFLARHVFEPRGLAAVGGADRFHRAPRPQRSGRRAMSPSAPTALRR